MNRSQHFPFLTWGASLITFLATEKQAKNLLKAWNTLMWPTSHSVPRDSPINIKTLNKSAFLRTTLETDHQQTPKTNLFLCELCCLPQWNNYKGRKRKRKTTDMRGFFWTCERHTDSLLWLPAELNMLIQVIINRESIFCLRTLREMSVFLEASSLVHRKLLQKCIGLNRTCAV